MRKVVLAFSGGLDTSYCAVYLAKTMNLEVHAVTVQTGGFSDDELKEIEIKAHNLGVSSFKVVDVSEQFYQECIKYLVYGNILKNNVYPLSVSAERCIQAIAVAEYAQQIGAAYVAHGSTGAGNDQVRFDMIFRTLVPDIEVLTPIRDQNISREEEIAYLTQHNVQVDITRSQYSINKGLWGTSVGGKETLNSRDYLPEEVWPTQVTATGKLELVLHFSKGQLSGLNTVADVSPVEVIKELQQLAQPYGIGRDIHVGDTVIGIKGRVGFEAAAPMIIIKAHHLLEKHTLTKQQLLVKEQLASYYGSWLHDGLMLDPIMRNIEAFLEDTQQSVTGKVFVTVLPFRFIVTGVETNHDLMNAAFGTYGELNRAWTSADVKGFAKILANQVSIHHRVNQKLSDGLQERKTTI